MEKIINWLTEDGLAIFLFHGVIAKNRSAVRNYTRKHLERDYFFRVVSELKKRGRPLSMPEVIHYHRRKISYPKNAFAITFDDGFENNYSIAAPILEDLNLPATFYLTTDFVDRNIMSWTDRLEWALENFSGGSFIFEPTTERWPLNSDEEKIKFLNYLREYLKTSHEINLDDFVSRFFQKLDQEEVFQSNDPLNKKLDWRQAAALARQPEFTVGGHTHRHLTMSFLSAEKLNQEIETSLEFLKQKAGIETVHYSYPEGLSYCYNQEVIVALKQRGIQCCPTAIPGVNRLEEDLFHLKRIEVV